MSQDDQFDDPKDVSFLEAAYKSLHAGEDLEQEAIEAIFKDLSSKFDKPGNSPFCEWAEEVEELVERKWKQFLARGEMTGVEKENFDAEVQRIWEAGETWYEDMRLLFGLESHDGPKH